MAGANSHHDDVDGRPRRWLGARRRRWFGATALAFVAAVAVWWLLGTAASTTPRAVAAPRPAPLPAATVALNSSATTPIPASFFGLSTEYWTLPLYERHLPAFERILAMLHVSGDPPLVLRIGGDSADLTYWDPLGQAIGTRAFGLTPAWLSHAAAVVRATHVRVIMDLNLVSDSPAMAARWARAAVALLPRGSLIGFEIGNEPDLYRDELLPRLGAIARSALHPDQFSATNYTHDFDAYARALTRAVGHVALLGPAIADPTDLDWLSGLLTRDRRYLSELTAHRYPLSACQPTSSPRFPTIARLLSEQSSAGMAQTVREAVALAHLHGVEFRLTELNSVTCGGRAGVSNSFATALWAPDALFELMRAGVDGVNLHIRADAINPPFTLTSDGVDPRPLLYGLLMFARTLGPGARLADVSLHEATSLHLKAWGVRLPDGALHVLVINKGADSADVTLRLGAGAPATVQRLLAPSPAAVGGVTLAGQQLGADATWHGREVSERIPTARRGYWLVVPRYSAALVTIAPPVSATVHA